MFSARQTPAAGTDALARLSWHDFEHLLGEHYREQGWRVEYHAAATSLKHLGSHLDLRLHRGNETAIVQCKHWDADQVDLPEVNELLSTMLNEAATRAVLVTRGRFSAEARAVPRRQPRLQLVDADVLRVMLKLPDHLDTPAPGLALPAVEARKAAAKRRGSHDTHSRLLPILLVAGITLLIGLFVWRAMSRRHDDAATRQPDSAEVTKTSPALPPPPAVTAPAAAMPATTAPVEAPVSRELAERARLRESEPSGSPRNAHRQSDDAMKVLEKNTREVGSAE
ncbi:restriction endonuclease [Luteibacter yeojuensis]